MHAVKTDCNFKGEQLEKKDQEDRVQKKEILVKKKTKGSGNYKSRKQTPNTADLPEDDNVEKIIHISRTTKVTKGGRKLNFGAIAVVGDKKGTVGCGFGKANEVPNAIKKSINEAKKTTIFIALKGNTIPHEVTGKYGAAVVLLKPAGEGTGVVAGNIIRAVCDAAGIKDILTKCLNSQTPVNVIKATLNGLMQLRHKNDLLESESDDEK